MVGTFYSAPAPGEADFVQVGQRVNKGQTLCIIEAMKVMNEIEAETAGVVREILVSNGQPVEFGQVLMRLDPWASGETGAEMRLCPTEGSLGSFARD
jgi:acetyl-CoA carboxylase biotin carboxyl carrier protein